MGIVACFGLFKQSLIFSPGFMSWLRAEVIRGVTSFLHLMTCWVPSISKKKKRVPSDLYIYFSSTADPAFLLSLLFLSCLLFQLPIDSSANNPTAKSPLLEGTSAGKRTGLKLMCLLFYTQVLIATVVVQRRRIKLFENLVSVSALDKANVSLGLSRTPVSVDVCTRRAQGENSTFCNHVT